MSNRERHSTRSTNNPDIASDVHELKALHAEPSVTPPEANRDKTRRVGHFPLVVGGLAVTTAAIVGGYFATKGDADPASAPKKDPEASAPVVPGEVAESPETVEYGISSAEYLNDPQGRVEAYYAQINQLYIDGITQEVAEDPKRFEYASDEEYIDQLTQGISGKFIDALYVDTWSENPALVEDVNNLMTIVDRTRELRLLSMATIGGDLQPYERLIIPTSVTATEDNMVTDVQFREANNASETSVQDNIDGIDINTSAGGEIITWVEVDGQLKISDIEFYN